ncbi:MAG: polysaccharide deacetylase family protein [Elusimicrobia bacterium]|nr:polysaccharide deacetylase family protein [Elusimicrobiota bacterium]
MLKKTRGTKAEQYAEQTRNKYKRWQLVLIFAFTTAYCLLPTACLLLSGCKKSKPGVEINYGAFCTDGSPLKKWVALTFDDGPRPAVLKKILATLEKENVKATFFVVGMNVKLYPEYTKKYIQLGHEIGNHTYSHRNYYELKKKKNMEEIGRIISQELDDCEMAIQRASGIKPLFMRMPNGFISPTVKKIAKEKKYIVVNWTFGCDWHKNSRKELIDKYLRSVESGAVFIFHEKEATAEALPAIIEGIKKKGYKIVSLRKILGIEEEE